jgi:hypothetical protein
MANKFAVLLAVTVFVSCDQKPALTASTPVFDLRQAGELIVSDVDRIERAVVLQSGHIAYTEPYRRRVVFVDVTTRQSVAYGRDGRGPGEFSARPQPLVKLLGDTVAVFMPAGGQVHLFTADSGYLETLPTPFRGTPNEFDCHSDDSALVYCRVEGSIGAHGAVLPAPAHLTEVPVLRFRIGDARFDSIWTVPGRGYKTFESNDGSILIRPEPLYPSSGFGVSSDGSLWRVLGVGLRVELRAPDGSVRVGPTWDLRPELVSASERDSILSAARNGPFGKYRLTVHGTRPVFRQVVVSPVGSVWVRLARAYGDSRYRVFNSLGQPVADVDLGEDETLVGLSDAVAYVLRPEGADSYALVGIAIPAGLSQLTP